jgi:hypothetical protein
VTRGQVIAIDGNELRHSMDGQLGKKAIHLVSAWASENRLILSQRKIDSKTNEIMAIPELLDALELAGCKECAWIKDTIMRKFGKPCWSLALQPIFDLAGKRHKR